MNRLAAARAVRQFADAPGKFANARKRNRSESYARNGTQKVAEHRRRQIRYGAQAQPLQAARVERRARRVFGWRKVDHKSRFVKQSWSSRSRVSIGRVAHPERVW
jgi:hypothetical protein